MYKIGKGKNDMTYEKALEASRALDAIYGFREFMEEIDRAIVNAEGMMAFDPKFTSALNELIEAELARLEQVLADL
jgi:hypothetical protein